MFCFKCGNKLFDDEVFCHKCGTKVAIKANNADQSTSQSENLAIAQTNEVSHTFSSTYSKANKRILKGIIVAIIIVIAIFIVGTLIATVANKEPPSLFEIAEEFSPLESLGYTDTYGDVIEWLISDKSIICDQEEDTAYLNYSGNISGGDYPIAFVIEISGLSDNFSDAYIAPYSMTLNNTDITSFLSNGGLEEIFWAYNHKDEYPTFMDYIEYSGSDSLPTFKENINTAPDDKSQFTDDNSSHSLHENTLESYDVFYLYNYVGLSIDEIISLLGEPLGYRKRYSTNYAIYNDVTFELDSSKTVKAVKMTADKCILGEGTFEKNRKQIIELLGEPSSEGEGLKINEDGSCHEMYTMLYFDWEMGINLTIEMLSPDEPAYEVRILE